MRRRADALKDWLLGTSAAPVGEAGAFRRWRGVILAAAVLGLLLQGGFPVGSGSLCLMAAQERETKDGWCQRPAKKMSKQAHACACHAHDCKADPRDPQNLSAHTDSTCLNFCHTGRCLCGAMDCP